MRECVFSVLILSFFWPAAAQVSTAAWKLIQDATGACQIAVPPDWIPYSDAGGAAVFRDASIAIAVVTTQPGQTFKPLSDAQLKLFSIPKGKVFENSARRLFYQDKTAASSNDANAYSAMAPGKSGTCSCHVVFGTGVSSETAKQIALTLAPVAVEKR